MSAILIAVVVLLVIIIGIYVATRRLPAPASLVVLPCKVDLDCAAPLTCDVATSICVDNALPGLLAAAKSAATALNSKIQSVASSYGSFMNSVNLMSNYATNSGLTAPSTAGIASEISDTLTNIGKYNTQIFSGYYTKIMSLTTTDSGTTIISATSSMGDIVLYLQLITQGFTPLIGDLNSFIGAIRTEASSANISIDGSIPLAYVNGIISQVNGFASDLPALAATVKQTGTALFSHYVSI